MVIIIARILVILVVLIAIIMVILVVLIVIMMVILVVLIVIMMVILVVLIVISSLRAQPGLEHFKAPEGLGAILGLCWGYNGMMERKMETTIKGLGLSQELLHCLGFRVLCLGSGSDEGPSLTNHMSYSLNSFKGGCIGDFIGDY